MSPPLQQPWPPHSPYIRMPQPPTPSAPNAAIPIPRTMPSLELRVLQVHQQLAPLHLCVEDPGDTIIQSMMLEFDLTRTSEPGHPEAAGSS